MIILSTHLDDAVFSCGSLLAGRDATVVTICAGIPSESTPPHAFDEAAGFGSGAQAMRARRVEDEEAAKVLDFEAVHLDCLEIMYSKDEPIREAVVDLLERVPRDELIIGPVGLRHPDHIAVASALKEVVTARGFVAAAYSDLPYAHVFGGPEPRATLRCTDEKRRAIDCYGSQLHGMDREALEAPERYHDL